MVKLMQVMMKSSRNLYSQREQLQWSPEKKLPPRQTRRLKCKSWNSNLAVFTARFHDNQAAKKGIDVNLNFRRPIYLKRLIQTSVRRIPSQRHQAHSYMDHLWRNGLWILYRLKVNSQLRLRCPCEDSQLWISLKRIHSDKLYCD